MSEDQKTESAETKKEEGMPVTKVAEVKPDISKEEVSKEDLDALEKAISEANSTLVSQDVQEQIRVAKEQAKKEAEVEFLKDQKVKELEEQLKKEAESKIQMQKEAAEKLEALKARVDQMSASRAVAPVTTPFDKAPDTPNTQLDMSAEDIAQIERDSFIALRGRTVNKN